MSKLYILLIILLIIMAGPVLKIARGGYDVGTADPKNLTIDSSRNQFKVAYSGQETFSLNSGNSYSYTKTITHNFGYVPQALAWSYSILDSGGGSPGTDEKFSALPFTDYVLNTPSNRLFVASIEKSSTFVKFKVYEDPNYIEGADPQPSYYTLSDMQLMYVVFVDEE